jgi:hypothetical protein
MNYRCAKLRIPALSIGLALLAGCVAQPGAAGTPMHDSQQRFWGSLLEICGQAFEGRVAEAPANDETFAGHRLVMHVRECRADEILIPFHVGENRSRTWVISRTSTGLRLKHDHRHADGSEEDLTQYGGDTAGRGTPLRQEFPADAFTAGLLPVAATNVWTVEMLPGELFVYALRREGTDRRYRIEFDLTRPVSPPPAPWGHE